VRERERRDHVDRHRGAQPEGSKFQGHVERGGWREEGGEEKRVQEGINGWKAASPVQSSMIIRSIPSSSKISYSFMMFL
jgi:hypothetical protein